MSDTLRTDLVKLLHETAGYCRMSTYNVHSDTMEKQAKKLDDAAFAITASSGSPSAAAALMEPDHIPVPREMLERMRPAVKSYALKAAQSVLSCKRGDLPAHYLETLQQDELKQDALLCALDDLLSIERHAVEIAPADRNLPNG